MPWAFEAAAALTAGALAGVGLLADAGHPPSTVAIALAGAFVPYAAMLIASPRGASQVRAVAYAVAAGSVLVAAPSVLSDDVYRYLWDARVLLSGVDPYAHAPDSSALAALRDGDWLRINHRPIPTIYPPLAQLLFALPVALWPSAAALKGLALLLHLLTAAGVARLTRGQAPPETARAVHLWLLNPLALSETALGGHVDVAVGLVVLLFALALVREREGLAAWLAGAVSGLKLLGFVLVPLLARRGGGTAALRRAGLALVLALVCLWPPSNAGHGDGVTSGLGHYSQRWRGNEGLFAVLHRGCRAIVDAAGDGLEQEDVGAQEIALPALAPVLRVLVGAGYDPRASLRAEGKQPRPPAVFDRDHLAGLLARGVALGVVLLIAFLVPVRRAAGPAGVRAVVLGVLLLTPQLHPWYLLWLLPLELALGRRVVLIWSAVALVAYAPLDGWLAVRSWSEPAVARPLQTGLVLGALAVERWWVRRCAAPSALPAEAESAR